MNYTATGMYITKSHLGGNCYKIDLESKAGKEITWIYPDMRNFPNWEPVLEALSQDKKVELTGLVLITKKGKKLVNADSPVRITNTIAPDYSDDMGEMLHRVSEDAFDNAIEAQDDEQTALTKSFIKKAKEEKWDEVKIFNRLKETLLN